MLSNSGKALLVSNSSKSLVLSNSGKRFDKKKYVKQVTGRHNDTELHLAAQRGDLAAVKGILGEIDAQMMGTLSGADFDAEVSESVIHCSIKPKSVQWSMAHSSLQIILAILEIVVVFLIFQYVC